MDKNYAVSEIIGVILLIGIIVSAFSIFAAIYLPTITPHSIPQVKLSIACSSNSTIEDGIDIEYPCGRGAFSCYPTEDPFDNESCENDCKTRYYSKNYPYIPENLEREILRCLEDCMTPMCSDLGKCKTLYICHTGGDSLDLDNMEIVVNNMVIPEGNWEIQQPGDNYTKTLTDRIFRVGSALRFGRDPTTPIDRVIVIYRPSSGGEYTLVMNQFGTDVN